MSQKHEEYLKQLLKKSTDIHELVPASDRTGKVMTESLMQRTNSSESGSEEKSWLRV